MLLLLCVGACPFAFALVCRCLSFYFCCVGAFAFAVVCSVLLHLLLCVSACPFAFAFYVSVLVPFAFAFVCR